MQYILRQMNKERKCVCNSIQQESHNKDFQENAVSSVLLCLMCVYPVFTLSGLTGNPRWHCRKKHVRAVLSFDNSISCQDWTLLRLALCSQVTSSNQSTDRASGRWTVVVVVGDLLLVYSCYAGRFRMKTVVWVPLPDTQEQQPQFAGKKLFRTVFILIKMLCCFWIVHWKMIGIITC